MRKRIIAAVIIVLSCSGILSGCYDSIEIDDLTYVIAIGLDKGKTQPLRLTLQYAIGKALGQGEGGGGGSGKIIDQITIEAPDLLGGLNMANGFVDRMMNLSHVVVTVISEELAKEDLSPYIHTIARFREFRPNMFIAISRGHAEDYLKSINPVQEIDPSKYYELLFATSGYTGFFPVTPFYKFYSDLESESIEPVAVLAGLSKYKSSKEFNPELNTAAERGAEKPLEGDYKAGQIPKIGDMEGEVMGLAVFKGAKMTGEMDGASATNYLMVTGEYDRAYISIPDPKFKDRFIVLIVFQKDKPERKVKFVDGKPQITVGISLSADIYSIQSGYNYESPENISIVETAASDFIGKDIEKFLNRTAQVYSSDICGFGKEAKGQFLTWGEWMNFNWFDRYNESAFEVSVDLKITRSGLIIRSNPFETE